MARVVTVGVFSERHLAPAVAAGVASVASIDLDHFKELNDDYGFAAGDAVLQAVESALAANLPDTAVVTRKGGDEYAVLFPGTAPEDALILLEEVRSHVASRPAAAEVDRPIDLRFGIAACPLHSSDPAGLMLAADEAQHRAKQQGIHGAIYVEDRMVLKSNYYPKGRLARLAKLSDRTDRTEASLLREALDDLLDKHARA